MRWGLSGAPGILIHSAALGRAVQCRGGEKETAQRGGVGGGGGGGGGRLLSAVQCSAVQCSAAEISPGRFQGERNKTLFDKESSGIKLKCWLVQCSAKLTDLEDLKDLLLTFFKSVTF